MNLSSFILNQDLSSYKNVRFDDVKVKAKRYSHPSPFKGQVLGHRGRMKGELIKFFDELKKNSNENNEVNISLENMGRLLNIGSGASHYRAKLLLDYNVIEFFICDETPPHSRSIRILDENFNFDNLNMRVCKNAK